MLNIQNPSTSDRAVDFFKQMANKLIDTGNNVAVKYGNGAMTPRFQTIGDKQAQDYQTIVNARNMLQSGAIRNDPRNNNYVYKGNVGQVNTPAQRVKVSTPTPTKAINKRLVLTRAPQPPNQPLIPTKTPNKIPVKPNQKYPLPTTTPYPSPTPIPGAGSTTMNADTNKFIETVILPMAKRYDVDPGIMAGQFANEGRLGGVGADRNNFYNIGVTDAIVAAAKASGDWSQVPGYSSPEAGVERYLKFISGTAPDSLYANGVDGSSSGKVGKKQFTEAWAKYRHNPPAFLKAIGPTYASSGEAYAVNTINTPEYAKYKQYQEIVKTIDKLNKQLANKKK